MSREETGGAVSRDGAGLEGRRSADGGPRHPPSRREALKLMAMAPLALALPSGAADPVIAGRAERAARAAQDPSFAPSFFTPREWRTVRLLADLVIPADAEAGGAVDAGVPEFLDFTMTDQPELQTPIRGGLRWLDAESGERFGAGFVELEDAQRAAILDDIAWPAKAPARVSQGVAFFHDFRDLVATGYFTSRVGIDYLKFRGNTVVLKWDGCPPEAVRHLGLEPGATPGAPPPDHQR